MRIYIIQRTCCPYIYIMDGVSVVLIASKIDCLQVHLVVGQVGGRVSTLSQQKEFLAEYDRGTDDEY